MKKKETLETQEAKYGEKMIELKIRFWANSDGRIIRKPKRAWTSGYVQIKSNSFHRIKPKRPKLFNSLLDIGTSIEKILKEQNIKLHIGSGMRGYISEERP